MMDDLDQWRVRILREAVRFIENEVREPIGSPESSRETILRVTRTVLRRTASDYDGGIEDERRPDHMPADTAAPAAEG